MAWVESTTVMIHCPLASTVPVTPLTVITSPVARWVVLTVSLITEKPLLAAPVTAPTTDTPPNSRLYVCSVENVKGIFLGGLGPTGCLQRPTAMVPGRFDAPPR